VNTVSIAVSRLSMDRTSQNDAVNDFVGQLAFREWASADQTPGSALVRRARLYRDRDTFAATPMHAWDTMYEIRDAYAWEKGRHGIKFGGDFHWYTWPMWGFFRIAAFTSTRTATPPNPALMMAAFRLRQSFAQPASREAAPGRNPADEFAKLGRDAFVEDR